MERRTFLTGAGVAALLPVAGGATAKDQSLGDGGTAARQGVTSLASHASALRLISSGK